MRKLCSNILSFASGAPFLEGTRDSIAHISLNFNAIHIKPFSTCTYFAWLSVELIIMKIDKELTEISTSSRGALRLLTRSV